MVRTIAYWIATVLVALGYFYGAYFELAQTQEILDGAAKLGYPLFFFTILGFWKVAAGLVILSPGLTRAKEWAYAGILINLTAAAATHIHMNDGLGDIVKPLILLGLAGASWALRPASRRLAGPWL